jgi:hypothetical protein
MVMAGAVIRPTNLIEEVIIGEIAPDRKIFGGNLR